MTLLLTHWKLGVMAVLLLALGVQTLRLEAVSDERDKWRDQAVKSNVIIEVQNAATARLKADSDRRKAESAAELERVTRETLVLQDQAERLRASAGRVVDGPCVISDELRKATGL